MADSVFKLPFLWIAFLALLPIAPFAAMTLLYVEILPVSWALIALTGLFGLLGLLEVLFYKWTCVIEIREDGIRMYKFWKLNWSDISSAKLITLFGLDYLLVGRRKGPLPYWIPLYFKGETTNLLNAIVEAAPSDSPIHSLKKSHSS